MRKVERLSNIKQWIVVLFLAIVSTKLVWYDFRTLDKENAEKLLFLSFFLYSIAIFPFVVFFIARQFLELSRSKLILFFFLLNVYGVVVSFLYGRADIYLYQDIYKMLFFPSGFAAALYLKNQQFCFETILKKLFNILICFAIFRLLIHLYMRTDSAIVYGTTHDIFLLSYSISLFWRSPRYLILTVLVFFLVVFGQKRTLLVGFVFLLSGSFIYFKKLAFKVIFGRVIIIVVLATFLLAYNFEAHDKFRRLYNTENTISQDIGKESKRLREVLSAIDNMNQLSPQSYIFGFGSGASFDDPVPNPITGYTKVHSFHFTPMAFVYRYGIIGILFLLTVYVCMTKVLYKYKLSNDLHLNFVIKSTLLFSMIMSMIVYSLVDDVLIGFLYGLYFIRKRVRVNG